FAQLHTPPRLYPYLRFTVSLAVAAQDSGPSGSLLLSRKNFPFSASCRFTPAHKNPHNAQNPRIGLSCRVTAIGSRACGPEYRSLSAPGAPSLWFKAPDTFLDLPQQVTG